MSRESTLSKRKKLFWENETDGNFSQHYLLKRQTPTLRPFMSCHTHDYAELVYVERGKALHTLNEYGVVVGKGDVLFMYPDTSEHCFREYDRSFSLLQILFQKDSFFFIQNRYLEPEEELFRDKCKNPLIRLTPIQQIWFEHNFDRLLINEGSLMEIERFLLNFIGLIRDSRNAGNSLTSSWLEKAFREIQEPKNFRKGTKGFVDLCSRSPEHVEREVKRRTGRTVTDVVNQARMAWASYMLMYSDQQIMDISYECGLESISYFYKLFHDHHGISPARFRKRAEQASVSTDDNPFIPFQRQFLL